MTRVRRIALFLHLASLFERLARPTSSLALPLRRCPAVDRSRLGLHQPLDNRASKSSSLLVEAEPAELTSFDVDAGLHLVASPCRTAPATRAPSISPFRPLDSPLDAMTGPVVNVPQGRRIRYNSLYWVLPTIAAACWFSLIRASPLLFAEPSRARYVRERERELTFLPSRAVGLLLWWAVDDNARQYQVEQATIVVRRAPFVRRRRWR